MNENTLVVTCGYAGDAHQIELLMPYYLHHKCPVWVLSPEDAPITATTITPHAGITFKQAGKRAYIGQDSLDRQIAHLRLVLQSPPEFKWFLLHDSDSVVLSSKLPSYLYADENMVWSNQVCDRIPGRVRPEGYAWPELAFQPPYFTSRSALTRMMAIADEVKADPVTPFIDWSMMAWTVRAGLPHRGFPEGASCGTPPGSFALQHMQELVSRDGKYILHAIKQKESLMQLAYARIQFMQRQNVVPVD